MLRRGQQAFGETGFVRIICQAPPASDVRCSGRVRVSGGIEWGGASWQTELPNLLFRTLWEKEAFASSVPIVLVPSKGHSNSNKINNSGWECGPVGRVLA